MPAPRAKQVVPDFDQALYNVSDCLSEARCARDQGHDRRARAFYAAAERYASRTGYVELLRLVWAYEEAALPVPVPVGQTTPAE
jgi:hypothetical protein